MPSPPQTSSRRALLVAAAAAAAGLHSTAGRAQAASWPQRPVRLLVPFPPGGGLDTPARLLADKLRQTWGKPVIVENKPGANTFIALQELVSKGADQHTFLVTHQLSFNLPTVLSRPMPFNPSDELVLVSPLIVEQLPLVARRELPGQTLAEILSVAKAQKATLKFGSYSIGSVAHMLALELAKSGVDVLHVPYAGTPALMLAMLSGDIDIGLANYGTAQPHLASGKLKAVGVMGNAPYRFLPQVPTLQSQGIQGFGYRVWVGLFAPRSMPADIIASTESAVHAALQSPEMTEQLARAGQEPGSVVSQADFRLLMADSIRTATAQLVAAGVKLDR